MGNPLDGKGLGLLLETAFKVDFSFEQVKSEDRKKSTEKPLERLYYNSSDLLREWKVVC